MNTLYILELNLLTYSCSMCSAWIPAICKRTYWPGMVKEGMDRGQLNISESTKWQKSIIYSPQHPHVLSNFLHGIPARQRITSRQSVWATAEVAKLKQAKRVATAKLPENFIVIGSIRSVRITSLIYALLFDLWTCRVPLTVGVITSISYLSKGSVDKRFLGPQFHRRSECPMMVKDSIKVVNLISSIMTYIR